MRTTVLSALTSLALFLAPAPTQAGTGGICCDPWTDLGDALSGTHGAPLLEGTGSLAGNTLATLSLTNALENAPVFVVMGLTNISVPFKGGVLVPSPDFLLVQNTDSAGNLDLVAQWPSGLLPGTVAYFQDWVIDPAGPAGFAASNAILGATPNPPVSGSFPANWISGTDCGGDPKVQVEMYNADTFILRQSMCTNFEGPFLYLFFGEDKVLMLDSGAGNIPIAEVVDDVINDWLVAAGKTSIELVVGHTHSHGDHIAGDAPLMTLPNTTVVGTSTNAVINFYGFNDWPNDQVTYDLGGRVLDIVAIPGHHSSHIAVYDRETAILVTGDTLYPGFLFINGAVSQGNFVTYKNSIQRLVDFTADKPVTWVMGTHVEMTAVPGVAYPYGTSEQPNERLIQLDRSHLLELHQAVQLMGSNPVTEVHDDFIIQPSN
ncbi:MAG: hydroxyacylglutathione hydrolase [Pseudohongiellaceae bacterium]|jgi:hydroxyacylglutathione hydrolase